MSHDHIRSCELTCVAPELENRRCGSHSFSDAHAGKVNKLDNLTIRKGVGVGEREAEL